MKKLSLRRGASSDAMLLIVVKLITMILGMATTRLLSQYLSVYDYGTYSQITLIASVVSSATIFGMMDGVNYFYHASPTPQEKESNVCSIFTLQCIVGTVAGFVVMALSSPLYHYFDNPNIRGLLIFAAVLPMLQNLTGMLQVLIVSVGKASILALRNFGVSAIRLIIVVTVVLATRSILVVLLTTFVLDILQIILFAAILRKHSCRIHFEKIRGQTLRQIVRYCAPMAVFIMIGSLNRDVDKYFVTLWTDTQTLALYTNASKMLPFDVVITSFTTVLMPQISQAIAADNRENAARLYRRFLEIAYISTTIACCAALSAAPQLMKLLYSNVYLSGLSIFCIYILVDMIRYTNTTMVLSASGKTGRLMLLSLSAIVTNIILNIVMYHWIGLEGLAVATLLTTVLMGIAIITLGAKELHCSVSKLFDGKYLLLFLAENAVLTILLYHAQLWLEQKDVHYVAILAIIGGSYGCIMLALNGKRLLRCLKQVNEGTT